ncbi:nickel-dependent lactate racemase [Halanaerobacter jeridensis]|uniref:Nickel-dependent lactate racemase n=1 Tax=Halanaerobacter jeridensis TaxID=706427 RepID=A0A938XQ63_9FIRM|nr:nickel-dependent lactate racemase [Halanaerobacter jeridensis]MBM7555406.1 nickel-dependent lactate racemase [Halanaerobacter jeridensis]
MKLKYGSEKVELDLDRLSQPQVLRPNEKEGVKTPQQKIEKKLKNPIDSAPLKELVTEKNPDSVVIIVNDVSRATPYKVMLPPLLEELHQQGVTKDEISLIIATGIHDPNTEEQNRRIFGDEIVDNYRLVSHDPDQNLADLGELSSGNQLYLNQEVLDADLLITTGVITPHYFAGFSGGRKSILPGVAGRDTIQFNHSRMVNLIGDLPAIEENPISQEMIEGAKLAGVDFILNVVTNSQQEIVEVVAGDLENAWLKGVRTSAEMYHVELEDKVDVAIVSAGGYPKDINIYQAQKALDNADGVVKEGGTIVLLAECRNGLGEETFEEWLTEAEEPKDNVERIREKFILGGHKAFAISKVVLEKDFILLSDFSQENTEMMFATKMDNLEQVLKEINQKYDDYTSIVLPQGGLTVPVIR